MMGGWEYVRVCVCEEESKRERERERERERRGKGEGYTGSGVSFVLYLSKQRYFANTSESFIVHNTPEINVSHQAIT